MLALRADPAERRGALFAGAFALAGFLLGLVLVLVGVDSLITRNLLVVLIPLIVLVAGGLGARRAGLLGLTGVAVLCAIGLAATVAVIVDWRYQRPEWRRLAHALDVGASRQGARAVLVQEVPGLYPLAIYLPGLRFMKHGRATVRELDVVAAGDGLPNAWFCWWGAACNLVPSPLDAALRIPGFDADVRVLRVEQFSVLRLRASTPVRLTQRMVGRAVRSTHQRLHYYLYVQPHG
jgi:hypothetical protein